MSKREKLKFKKRIKEQILQEMSRTEVAPQETTQKPAIVQAKPIVRVSSPVTGVQTEQPLKVPDALDSVKYDLKKSAIIIGSIIAVIVIVFFIDNKTSFLLKISDSLFKVLHIGA